jgi:hypothetical protein
LKGDDQAIAFEAQFLGAARRNPGFDSVHLLPNPTFFEHKYETVALDYTRADSPI